MAAKKIKRLEKKVVSRKRVVGPKNRAAKKSAAGPTERTGEVVVAAARRLWLEADGLRTAHKASKRKPVR